MKGFWHLAVACVVIFLGPGSKGLGMIAGGFLHLTRCSTSTIPDWVYDSVDSSGKLDIIFLGV
jgi:hypothetical protein